ncbi:MAG: hypothetical protein ACTSPI_00225 [Candidatus Heimdallarchaeaceae archaeon]
MKVMPYKTEIRLYDKQDPVFEDVYPLSKIGIKIVMSLLNRLITKESDFQVEVNHYKNAGEHEKRETSEKFTFFNQSSAAIRHNAKWKFAKGELEKAALEHMMKTVPVVKIAKANSKDARVYISSAEREDFYEDADREYTTGLFDWLTDEYVLRTHEDDDYSEFICGIDDVLILTLGRNSTYLKREAVQAKDMGFKYIWYCTE